MTGHTGISDGDLSLAVLKRSVLVIRTPPRLNLPPSPFRDLTYQSKLPIDLIFGARDKETQANTLMSDIRSAKGHFWRAKAHPGVPAELNSLQSHRNETLAHSILSFCSDFPKRYILALPYFVQALL